MIYQIFGTYPQAYQPYNIRLVEGLKKKGLPIQIVSLNNIPLQKRQEDVIYTEGVETKFSISAVAKSNKLKETNLKKRYKFYKKYSYIVDNPDSIFHFHNLQNINAELLNYLAENKIKYVISLRGYDVTVFPLLRKKNQTHLRKLLRHAWKIHSVCKSLVEEAKKYDETIESKTQVIYRTPNLNDVFSFTPREQLKQTIQIFTLSRVHWKKCIVESLISFKKLLDEGQNIHYHIIGGYQGNEEKRLIFTIHKLGLQEKVTLHGFKTEEEFQKVIKTMDFCWLPTINEGIPNTLYFLLKSGVPCIASATDGIPEVIQHGENGLLFEPYNFNQLTKITKQLIQDDDLRMSICEKASNLKLQSIEQEISAYLKLYEV